MIPQVLAEIRDFMSENPNDITLDGDGRIVSANHESIIIDTIAAQFPIQVPTMRNWWDFAIVQNGIFYPVNIKLTALGGAADNLNCKLGIYYALTGQIPAIANESSCGNFFRELQENICENERDYYFMVFNKKDMSDVFVNRLKAIKTLMPNGNNLPFQCKWNQNRTPIARDFNQARDFILCNIAKSVMLRSDIYVSFKHYFPNYLNA